MTILHSRYAVGILWFVLSLAISVLNDSVQKHLSGNISFFQVVFFRFFFGSILLLPFLLSRGKKGFHTPRLYIHVIRGIFLFCGISIWCYGLTIVPMATATIVTFTIPLFVLILAPIFLKEKISRPLFLATIVGFIGAIISFDIMHASFNLSALILIVSALLFAGLDIINKKFIHQESTLSMLFYSALFTAILAFIPAMLYWVDLSIHDYLVLMGLGLGGNAILFCILKAFHTVPASALSPYRYLELIFSSMIGLIIFNESPTMMLAIGAAIIIPSTFFIAVYKKKTA